MDKIRKQIEALRFATKQMIAEDVNGWPNTTADCVFTMEAMLEVVEAIQKMPFFLLSGQITINQHYWDELVDLIDALAKLEEK